MLLLVVGVSAWEAIVRCLKRILLFRLLGLGRVLRLEILCIDNIVVVLWCIIFQSVVLSKKTKKLL